ncbi:MAG TPA: branched-chain amino acid ABC transporter substrate-binding protein [Baekduia sp.]|nr:branched-chain amino acid ABC transporter substrate-binding protein [Baekduia sp.]
MGRSAAAAFALVAALAVTGCGNDVDNGVSGDAPSDTSVLTVYVSLPGKGPNQAWGDAIARGINLAQSDAKGVAGGKTIKLKRLDDTGPDGVWDDGQVADNAREAVRDKSTIAYIGELESGASALSIPILNEAGVLQVSPASGYAGLTRNAGFVQGEPDKYYPSGRRNFARILPGDDVEAAAQVQLQSQRACTSLHIFYDEELYGTGLAKSTRDAAKKASIVVAGETAFEPGGKDYTALGEQIADDPPDCAFVGVSDIKSAVLVWRALHQAAPEMKLFGPALLVNPSFTSRLGGAGRLTFLTSPVLRRSDYPASSRAVLRKYAEQYGAPAPMATLYGYATMQAILGAIDNASGSGSLQRRTIRSFFDSDHDSVIGRFSINDDGDSSLSRYGAYTVIGGEPHFDRVIETKSSP